MRRLHFAAVVVLAGALNACIAGKIVDGRRSFYSGDYAAASDTLFKLEDKEGKDRVLALLELGTALHEAGRYAESARVFLEADRQIEINDVVRVGQQAGTMVTNETIKTFKPESFEKVLLHTYASMNFMLLDDWSAARVEAKRALAMLDSLEDDLRNDPFTRFVCGLAYEVMGDNDDAYIEYKKVVENAPGFAPIYPELYRLAARQGWQEASKWGNEMKNMGYSLDDARSHANLIVFVGAGRGPYKIELNTFIPPYANRFVIPSYRSSNSVAHHAVVRIGNGEAVSHVLTDINPVAELALQKRMAKIIAKEAARVAAKEAIVQGIEEQDTILGLAARLAFIASEAADTRAWETLPRFLGAAMLRVPPGEYTAEITFFTADNQQLETTTRNIKIAENRRSVLSVRSIR